MVYYCARLRHSVLVSCWRVLRRSCAQQEGWQDEIYWFSTCVSMLRHLPPIPSVLADFPAITEPPALLRTNTVLGWFVVSQGLRRYAGKLAQLCSCRVSDLPDQQWPLSSGASVDRLPMAASRGPGLFALVVQYLRAIEAGTARCVGHGHPRLCHGARRKTGHDGAEPATRRMSIPWLIFGGLLGLAATTSPRTWPLVFAMFAADTRSLCSAASSLRGVPVRGSRLRFVTATLILLPIGLNAWTYFQYVHQASSHDAVNISPLLGGSWDFRHSSMQVGLLRHYVGDSGDLPGFRNGEASAASPDGFSGRGGIEPGSIRAGAGRGHQQHHLLGLSVSKSRCLLAVTRPPQNRLQAMVARALASGAAALHRSVFEIAKESDRLSALERARSRGSKSAQWPLLVPKGKHRLRLGKRTSSFQRSRAAPTFAILKDWTTPGTLKCPRSRRHAGTDVGCLPSAGVSGVVYVTADGACASGSWTMLRWITWETTRRPRNSREQAAIAARKGTGSSRATPQRIAASPSIGSEWTLDTAPVSPSGNR